MCGSGQQQQQHSRIAEDHLMPIPDYQAVMLPLLKLASDRKEHYTRDAITTLADQFKLTEEERSAKLPSGVDSVFDNRAGWARTYLKKAKLIEYTKRGYFKITECGENVLAQAPIAINNKFLRQFTEFVEFQSAKKDVNGSSVDEIVESSGETPEEAVLGGYLKLRKEIESDLLLRIKQSSPEFFERLVVKLLTTMGYGGSLADAGKAIGKSGYGGIDGVIKEDKLGLDLLYIQAKRWNDTQVGSPEVQKFVGALYGKKAKKGVFITTSSYSKAALAYADGLDSKVILIDGERLVELMFEHGVGVSPVALYEIKRIDSDFFDELAVLPIE